MHDDNFTDVCGVLQPCFIQISLSYVINWCIIVSNGGVNNDIYTLCVVTLHSVYID